MKNKPKIRIFITLIVGLILLISNSLLVILLLYNFDVALAGFQIPVNGVMVNYYFDDGLEGKLLVIGIIIAISTTILGTVFTYFIMGKVLNPLQKLSDHMKISEKENLLEKTNIKSNLREIDSLIDSFNFMNEKLLAMFNNQKHFSSFVAHEFRTPLAIIQTNIEVYKKQPPEEKDHDKIISLISTQVSNLTMLVTQILNLVAIQRVELKDRVPINILLEEVVDDLEDYALEKNVTLNLTFYDKGNKVTDIPVDIIGNHNLLYQAFFNLVENGIKYNVENGTVSIILNKFNDDIFIKICDTGCGIPENEKENIFIPFYRCKKTKTCNIQGNGIGLAFSKHVFDHHKCTISLDDKNDGKGTCFLVTMKENLI